MIRSLLITALIIPAVAAGVAARQGLLRIYVANGSGYTNAGTMPTGEPGSVAIVCAGKKCHMRDVCESCHTGAAASGSFANTALHEREFSRRAMRVTTTPLAFGDAQLRRDGAQLMLAQSPGQGVALPADAVILPDRSGRAAYIAFRGDRPPGR